MMNIKIKYLSKRYIICHTKRLVPVRDVKFLERTPRSGR